MTHTPGPWKVGGKGIVTDKNDNEIAEVYRYGVVGAIESEMWSRMECFKGNAVLISASPMLLNALKRCEEWMAFEMSNAELTEHDLDGHEADHCTLCLARAAIGAAEGRDK